MATLGEKIREFRQQRGLKMYEVADMLGYSRPTYMAIESNKKQPTVPELRKLVHVLGVSLEEVLFDTAQIATRDFGIDKYKQVVLNALSFGADTIDNKITKTKLAKLVYLADFAWFYEHLTPMTGLAYRRIAQGPVPDQYFRVIDELFTDGAINIEPSGTAMMLSANEKAPTSHLNQAEIELIETISRAWQDKSTQEVVDFTHEQIPWRVCRPGELIPYELITQEDPGHVY